MCATIVGQALQQVAALVFQTGEQPQRAVLEQCGHDQHRGDQQVGSVPQSGHGKNVYRLAFQLQHSVHLHGRSLGQRGHTNRRSRRVGLLEVIGHYLIDQRKVAQVGEEDIQLGHIS